MVHHQFALQIRRINIRLYSVTFSVSSLRDESKSAILLIPLTPKPTYITFKTILLPPKVVGCLGFAFVPHLFQIRCLGFAFVPYVFPIRCLGFAFVPHVFQIRCLGFAFLPYLFQIRCLGFAFLPYLFQIRGIGLAFVGIGLLFGVRREGFEELMVTFV